MLRSIGKQSEESVDSILNFCRLIHSLQTSVGHSTEMQYIMSQHRCIGGPSHDHRTPPLVRQARAIAHAALA